ncbi:MAG TPA: YciI family protein [Chitinivibrionales bacterium]|nr:YciI family protein [Chitinivibrionales bacterium]
MRFMMLMIPKRYGKALPGVMPDAEMVAAMSKYNASLKNAGVLISLEGLHPPSAGARVIFSKGNPVVARGPFPKVKETLGGYWMINVSSLEEAISWASRCPAEDNATIEIRRVQEFEEFPADVQKVGAGFRELQTTQQ